MTDVIELDAALLFKDADMSKAAGKFREDLTRQGTQFAHAPVALLGEKLTDAIVEEMGAVDILGLFAQGWAKAKEIRDHADPAKHRQDRTTYVKLGKHGCSTKLEPVVTVSFAGFTSPPVKFGLTISGDVDAVELAIREAHIRAVGGGTCKIKAALDYGGTELWSGTLKQFDVPGTHRFKMPGIPLRKILGGDS